MRFLPARFASYRALSASRTRLSGFFPSSGIVVATPKLMVIFSRDVGVPLFCRVFHGVSDCFRQSEGACGIEVGKQQNKFFAAVAHR